MSGSSNVIHGEGMAGLAVGLDILARCVGPTIGPIRSNPVVARVGQPHKPPQPMGSGADLCRRLTGLEDPVADIGLRLGRDAAIGLSKTTGDGTASAITMAAHLTHELQRLVAAGWAPVAVRAELAELASQACRFIDSLTQPFEPERLSLAIDGALDVELAGLLVEAAELLGPDTPILVRRSPSGRSRLEFVDGASWETVRLYGRTEAVEVSQVLEGARVILVDHAVMDSRAFAEALGKVGHSDDLLVITREMSPEAYAVVVANRHASRKIEVVRTPGEGTNQGWALDDLAVLTEGNVISAARGADLRQLDPDDIGRADRVVVGRTTMTLVAPRATRAESARRAESIRASLADELDATVRLQLEERIARLSGGMAIVWVGGRTESETELHLDDARRAVLSLRAAVTGGSVPGAGASYLGAARDLGMHESHPPLGGVIGALCSSLSQPTRWIIRNTGEAEPTVALRAAWQAAPSRGYDAHSGTIVNLRERGIFEPRTPVVEALRMASSLAGTLVSVAALVLPPKTSATRHRRPA